MKNFKDMWEDSAANSVGKGGVDMPADVQHDKKKKKKAFYDGRTKEGKKFVEKMLARRKVKADAEQVNASKQNAASVSMKEEAIEEANLGQLKRKYKRDIDNFNKRNKDLPKKVEDELFKYAMDNDGIGDDPDDFDDWLEKNIAEAKAPKIKGLSIYGSEVTGLRAKDGKMYSAKPVVMAGKLAYRVTDEFGSFETLPLKKFAAKFG
jgi:hypothetical protein